MGMHFKLGLYEHQSAGAIQAIINMLHQQKDALLQGPDNIERIKITAYEPAYGIIGDPAKRNPTTRQSADHSMVYIIATVLRKAFKKMDSVKEARDMEELWQTLMLNPLNYSQLAIHDEVTRSLMSKIEFEHGGPEYDSKYPEGIPTSVQIQTKSGQLLDSGLVMFPGGHARCKDVFLEKVLRYKFNKLADFALAKEDLKDFLVGLANVGEMANEELVDLYDCNITFSEVGIDEEIKTKEAVAEATKRQNE